ncbi:hypothetical protein CDAR_54451 [Caerostris darwini]|uniref:Uncharacterized protein n=2 Tax=Caerostris darwini TaxID=1538125 RepID=A0AAV4Q9A3_9ARAC|nr:hypothetical protein CDAR_54451 [Caerostris darwini]
MYFPTKLGCQTYRNSTLEHEPHPENSSQDEFFTLYRNDIPDTEHEPHPENSSQDEFFTLYRNDIPDTGNSEEISLSTFNASEGSIL